jgi:hypothetical protein
MNRISMPRTIDDMMQEEQKKFRTWVKAIMRGPMDHEESGGTDCRKCHHIITIDEDCEPTALCHHCAQEFVHIALVHFMMVFRSAEKAWRSAAVEASDVDANAAAELKWLEGYEEIVKAIERETKNAV